MSRIPAVLRLKNDNVPAIAIVAVLLAILCNMALATQDKYTVQVPGGLSFSEFKGTRTGSPFPSARPRMRSPSSSPIR